MERRGRVQGHNTTQHKVEGQVEKGPQGVLGSPESPTHVHLLLVTAYAVWGLQGVWRPAPKTCWPSPLGPLGLETPQAMARQLPIPVTR